jgi:hypothetical protein
MASRLACQFSKGYSLWHAGMELGLAAHYFQHPKKSIIKTAWSVAYSIVQMHSPQAHMSSGLETPCPKFIL